LVKKPSSSVRSALVELGKQHLWGSGWDTTLPLVKPGESSSTATEVNPQIVPLIKASGSRVSRILEGSMDMP